MENHKEDAVQQAKRLAGMAAAQEIQDGMVVGLGTGSTVYYFIQALGERCRQGLNIKAVATSQRSMIQAQSLNIPMISTEDVLTLDVTVDGADEIDPESRMIKGGGGALLREKILAYSSASMTVIVDESKLVKQLGKFPLPVEITSFAYQTTIHRLQDLGYKGVLRLEKNRPLITDNGNYIVDIHLKNLMEDPVLEHHRIKGITGVVETGIFFDVAKQVIVGFLNGSVEIRRDIKRIVL